MLLWSLRLVDTDDPWRFRQTFWVAPSVSGGYDSPGAKPRRTMEIPSSPTDVLLLPLLLVFFGGFVYGVALAKGLREYALPTYRWAGIALISLAILIGARSVWAMVEPGNGPFYRSMIQGRKIVMAHYLGLLLPLIALGLAIGTEIWFKRYRRDMG